MTLLVRVYGPNSYTKTGKLKKNAVPQYGRTFFDVGQTAQGDVDAFMQETAKQLKKEYDCFSSPYIFTHIVARNISTGTIVYIHEDVRRGLDDIMVSPVELLKLLKA